MDGIDGLNFLLLALSLAICLAPVLHHSSTEIECFILYFAVDRSVIRATQLCLETCSDNIMYDSLLSQIIIFSGQSKKWWAPACWSTIADHFSLLRSLQYPQYPSCIRTTSHGWRTKTVPILHFCTNHVWRILGWKSQIPSLMWKMQPHLEPKKYIYMCGKKHKKLYEVQGDKWQSRVYCNLWNWSNVSRTQKKENHRYITAIKQKRPEAKNG